MLRRRWALALLICIAAAFGMESIVPAQQAGEIRNLAIPVDVEITLNQTFVVLTGKSTGASTLFCLPEPFKFQHNAVAIDPGGGHAAQRTEVVIGHWTEEAASPGTRFRIEDGPAPCNSQYQLWRGRVE